MGKTKYLDLLAQYGINNAHPGGFAMSREMLRHETLERDMVLLDIGCGTGQTSAYIASHYPCRIVAADINPKMLERAGQTFAKNHLDVSVVRANAADLPFRKNSFHIVLSESVTAFTDIPKTLREYYRVLKPGGVLLAIEVTAFRPLTEEEVAEIKTVIGLSRMPQTEEWLTMFHDAGFSSTRLLYQQKMNWRESLAPDVSQAFHEYSRLMFRLRTKLGYGVYRCTV